MLPWRILLFTLIGLLPLRSSSAAEHHFDVNAAKKAIDAYETSFLQRYESGTARFYGRLWARTYARSTRYRATDLTVWQHFVQELAARGDKPERLDCTLYAQEILKAGMGERGYLQLRREHQAIWKARGFAGWSVAHLLTEQFNWRAYAIISRSARYYKYYLRHFKSRSKYPVWKQPDIKIEGYFIREKNKEAIEQLLKRGRFGWGFSGGGIHTWITYGEGLRECHWDCGPAKKYDIPSTHYLYQTSNLKEHTLFKTTRFIDFTDYHVHLVVFPPE